MGCYTLIGDDPEPKAVKARKGVIMTCGGFEFNEELKNKYLKIYPFKFEGWRFNTGDGIRMVQEVGANLGLMPTFYQGLFLSPTVVAGALKGAIFAANVYEKLGFACVPNATEDRHDIIQAVTLGSPEAMVAFCKGIQAAAPVDSYVTPEPWAMPGYEDEVIMAAGAFVQGSSIELSADGPIRPPYAVYFQGGLTWYHAKLGILLSVQKMVEAGLAKLPEV